MAGPRAVKAVKEEGKSILVSGVVKVEGAFSFSDIITVHDAETGQVIGKGRTRLGAAAIKDLLHGQKNQRASSFTGMIGLPSHLR